MTTVIYQYRAFCSVHDKNEIIWSETTPVSDATHTYTIITQINKIEKNIWWSKINLIK